jgi:hypothetical protein
LQALDTQLTGKELHFRTEKEGIVLLPVAKSSFSKDRLLDNIGQVIKTIFENKPERFGKGKKSGLSAKVPGTCYERAFARRKDMVFDWFCERSIQRVPFSLIRWTERMTMMRTRKRNRRQRKMKHSKKDKG